MTAAHEGPSERDRIARTAASLIETGQAIGVKNAIRKAADVLGLPDGPMPGHGEVRKHAQAMAMQALGEAGYRESRRNILRIAEELMTVLEQCELEPLLMGRAAAGQLDAGVTLHIRLYTDKPLDELAHVIVDFGYEEPSFDTVQTMYGALNRMRLREEGVPIILTRCPPTMNIAREVDAFTGKSIAFSSLQRLRSQLDAA